MKDDQSELFVVVDEDDNIIDHRPRYECHTNKDLIHRGVGVILFNDKGEVLLQKRSKHKDTHPGYYDISVAGHCAKDETYEETALREMQEEIGITTYITFVQKQLIRFLTETEYDTYFTGKHNGPFAINEAEVERVQFMKPEEIRKHIPKLTDFAKIGLKAVGVL